MLFMPSRFITFVLGVLSTCLACASAPAARGATCEPVPANSPYLIGGAVYRECEVDRRARSRGRAVRPETFDRRRPPGDRTVRCYSVDLEFVVDASGIPELLTAQVVRTNHEEYAEAVLATLSKWRYRSASRGGVPVRQIVQERREMTVQVVTVAAGDVPRLGRRPVC